MRDFHYKQNANLKEQRRRRLRVFLASFIVVGLAIVGYIIYDALSSSTVVTETPPATSTLGQQAEQAVFDNNYFHLEAETGWRRDDPLEDEPLNFRFQKFENGFVRQDLTVYVNSLPRDAALTHVLPVEKSNPRVVALQISPKCDSLQPNKDNRQDITLSWAGVSFLCDPDLNAYIVGTSHAVDGYNLRLGNHTFFFVYRDLRAAGQLDDFVRLLRGFEAK